jgi:hypothetical protein
MKPVRIAASPLPGFPTRASFYWHLIHPDDHVITTQLVKQAMLFEVEA